MLFDPKISNSKDSIENEIIEIHSNSSQASRTSRIPILSSCFRSSNSSLESLEIEDQPKTSLLKNSNTSLASSIIPSCLKSSNSTYTLALEKEYESLQGAFFALTSHFAKVQFRLRQIIQAKPCERDCLLAELTEVAFCGIDEIKFNNMPQMEKDLEYMGNVRRRQGYLIDRLREQLEYLSEQRNCDGNREENRKKSVRIDENAKK
ncbi:RUN domain-containing protein 1 [Episyrphus balteatus]|uniref:RUN domain-containing protein 1 n=1 Tax=Episyrphus balteatus TaxID=286459 RepID=UPI002486CB52|nr:RUN domain-containing protein 1 [Episyrphus balteatus]